MTEQYPAVWDRHHFERTFTPPRFLQRPRARAIGLAVMATTFAICAVFVPVAFMGGIIGKFFYPFGITVVVAVLVSLFVSFTLDPMLSAVWADPPATRMKKLWGIGHAIRATDWTMDRLHTGMPCNVWHCC